MPEHGLTPRLTRDTTAVGVVVEGIDAFATDVFYYGVHYASTAVSHWHMSAFPSVVVYSFSTCLLFPVACWCFCLQVAILLGGFPRRPGMERGDLIEKNAGIMKVI